MIETTTMEGQRWLLGILLALGLVTGPTLAVLSDNTDRIHGSAPTVTGTVTLKALFPDGTTVVTDNATLGWALRANQFTVSPTVVSPVLQDIDGDSGLSYQLDMTRATLTWTYNGTPLTSAQLASPLGNWFAGKTLVLKVSAPMIVSSVTGLPTTAETQFTTYYTVNVDISATLSIDLDSDIAHVNGGVINMTVTARRAGVPSPGTVFSVSSVGVADRQGNTSGWGTNYSVLMNGNTGGSFTTGANGKVVIPVTHPNGVGVKTTLRVNGEGGLATTDVTFSVATSPNVQGARFYGYMPDTLTVNGVTLHRPYLNVEIESDGAPLQALNKESWGMYSDASAVGRVCGQRTNLLSDSEWVNWSANGGGPVARNAGWPQTVYRTSNSSYNAWVLTSVADGISGNNLPTTATRVVACVLSR
ncbi:adhesion domain-containing protein [Yersinia intermedia]|uniref:adhesion domain-containing protein n=1 Tax=Yersinia intermedia TaxID=631 RepID=UPI0030D12E94